MKRAAGGRWRWSAWGVCALGALVILWAVALGGGEVLAQSGGSIGGGSFSGGGGGGGGGGGYSGGGFGGGGFGGGRGYTSYGGGGGGTPMSWETFSVLAVIFLLVFALPTLISIWGGLRRWWDERTRLRVRVTRVRFGVAAPYGGVMEGLELLSKSAEVGRPEGLARLVRDAALLLRRHADSVRYVAVHEAGDFPLREAEAPFQRLAHDERSRYTREVVRRDPAGLRRGPNAKVSADGLLDENGDFGIAEYMVVTFVLAHRLLIGRHDDVVSNAAMLALLRDLGDAATDETVAVELVWSPAAETDILAEREMIVAYEDLLPLG